MTHPRLQKDDFIALRSLAQGAWWQGYEISWKFNNNWRVIPYSTAALDAADRLEAMGLVECSTCPSGCHDTIQLTAKGQAFAARLKAKPLPAIRSEPELVAPAGWLARIMQPIRSQVSVMLGAK